MFLEPKKNFMLVWQPIFAKTYRKIPVKSTRGIVDLCVVQKNDHSCIKKNLERTFQHKTFQLNDLSYALSNFMRPAVAKFFELCDGHKNCRGF